MARVSASTQRLPVRNVSIARSWADALNVEYRGDSNREPTPAIISLLDRFVIPSGCLPGANGFAIPFRGSAIVTPKKGFANYGATVAALLASFTAEGLARTGGNGFNNFSSPFLLPNLTAAEVNGSKLEGLILGATAQGGISMALKETADNVSKWVRIDMSFSRFGYGYRWLNNATAQFGVCVLLLHVAVALLHCVWIAVQIARRRGVIRCYDATTDLVALALNSAPSEELQNTCAGIGLARTWRKTVAVREKNGGHLELVVRKERNETELAAAERLYGSAQLRRRMRRTGTADNV